MRGRGRIQSWRLPDWEAGNCYHQEQEVERVMGIEPTYAAWKAAVLPLNYTRNRRANHTPRACLVNSPPLASSPDEFAAPDWRTRD